METIDRFCTALVLNAAWQVALIAAAAALAARPQLRASVRYRMWLAAALLAPILPVATAARLVLPLRAPAVAAVDGMRASAHPAANVVATTTLAPAPYSLPVPSMPGHWAVVVLLAVGGYRLASLLRAARHVTQLRRSSEPATSSILAIARHAAASRELPVLAVRTSSTSRVPVTLGVFSPTVVLPEALARSAARPVLEHILAHEAEHVRRHDLAWQLLATLASVPIAFHPATRLIATALDASREQACDDAVAVGSRQRRSYARALVAVASRAIAAPAPPLALAAADPATLEQRIARLLRPSPRGSRAQTAAAVLLLSCALGASWAFAVTPEQAAAAAAGGASAPDTLERMALGLEPADGTYHYDTAGRRDPFRNPRTSDDVPPVGTGLGRYKIDEIALRGIVTTPQGPVALLVAPDTRTYFARPGQRLRNGVVTEIESQVVLLREDLDLDGPLATARTRERRWSLHGESSPER